MQGGEAECCEVGVNGGGGVAVKEVVVVVGGRVGDGVEVWKGTRWERF